MHRQILVTYNIGHTLDPVFVLEINIKYNRMKLFHSVLKETDA